MLSGGGYGSRHTMRAVAKEAPMPSPDRLLTDRSSYLAYLESQLERVSAACLTVQSFDERIEQTVQAVRCLEDKTLNLARLVATQQQFVEAQEAAAREAQEALARRLRAVEGRLAEVEEPARAADWEAKLRAVSAQVEAKLAQADARAEARLQEAAERLRSGMEDGYHVAHVALEARLGDATGRLSEVERRVHSLDEYAHASDTAAAVAGLAARVGGAEDSLAHLARSDGGLKEQLGAVQAAVAQLKTAVVALELRPPLGGDAGQSQADCMQWLERAREALRQEVASIQEQHGALVASMGSAAAAAAAAPASPQKALAAQVLGGMQAAVHSEVGRELQALRLADQWLQSVGGTFKQPAVPAATNSGTEAAPDVAAAACSDTGGKAEEAAAGAAGTSNWTIAAAGALAASGYPAAPSSQQAVSAAANGALAQLQQLAGGEQQLAAAAAALAAAAGPGVSGGSGGGLRSTFGEMHKMLQSVTDLLQPEQQGPGQQRPSEAAYQAAASRYLSRSSTLTASPPRKQGSAASRLASFARSGSGAARDGGVQAGGGAAAQARRQRLQELYAELQQ